MLTRNYRFAGVELAVSAPEEAMYENERHLAPFAVEKLEDPHRFTFSFAEELEAPAGEAEALRPGFRVYADGDKRIRYIGSVERDWRNAYLRVESCGKEHRVTLRAPLCGGRISAKLVLEALEAERLIARAGGFILHCSYIDIGGRAVLFTAPSGTGKSTQADLWHRFRGAEIVNGDRAAVRCTPDGIRAEGIPFAGSSPYCRNRSLPLAAVVYLAQAPQTTIRRLTGREAFFRIWEGCSVNTWDKQDLELVSRAVQETAGKVPIFYLPCTPDESAVTALEEALRKLGSV